jgi:hypothetical protein
MSNDAKLDPLVERQIKIDTILDVQQVAMQASCAANMVAMATAMQFCKLLHKCETMEDVAKLLNDAEALIENEQ